MKIRLESLNAYYGSSHVLHDVNLVVGSGESVALVGRNGAGKSTTLHSIAGILRKVTGRILLDDTDVTRKPPYVIAKLGLGLVPETRRVFADLTVEENLRVGASRKGQGQRSVNDILEMFPILGDLLDRKAVALSGGEQQVLAIARALVTNPQVLLLDEPTEGLAPRIVELLEEQLQAVRRTGVTILLSEQQLTFAVALTDRTYVIDRGVIRFEGPSAEVAARREVREAFLAV
jgi:branched-chain amino acid transport system ATP-binding protein